MCTIKQQNQRMSDSDLTQIIEPLANFVCAADRPRDTLLSALAVLFEQVQGTHKAALMHIASRSVDSLGLAS